jgi:hypothetical protein
MKLHNIEPHPIERSASVQGTLSASGEGTGFSPPGKRFVVLRGGVKFYAASPSYATPAGNGQAER